MKSEMELEQAISELQNRATEAHRLLALDTTPEATKIVLRRWLHMEANSALAAAGVPTQEGSV